MVPNLSLHIQLALEAPQRKRDFPNKTPPILKADNANCIQEDRKRRKEEEEERRKEGKKEEEEFRHYNTIIEKLRARTWTQTLITARNPLWRLEGAYR